ncbi:MAG: beta-lactamase family protein [Bacteroidales bacterium]|nr:beta-lactamase family protein [Bacteroidales bacterium]
MKTKFIISTIVVTALMLTVTLQAQVFPTTRWQRANPAEHGFDVERLEQARRFIIDSMHTTGVVVVVGGEVIFQYGEVERPAVIASVRKSLLSMLMGRYVEDGTIDLSLTMADLGIDDVDGLLPIEKQATIHHLITSRSGVFHNASNAGDDYASRPARGSKQPGEFFLYNNWDFNAAGAIFEQLVGRDIYEVFQDDLAIPIGMQDWDLSIQRKTGDLTRSRFPAYHFRLSTRDKARLGLLMLRNGMWEDQRLISESWIERSTAVFTPRAELNPVARQRRPYGNAYMWWVFDVEHPTLANHAAAFEGAYTGTGYMGQFITVIPALDMVVAHTTDRIYGRRIIREQYHTLLKMLVDAKK